MPAAAFSRSRLLLDGDRFRMESPEANYEGIFTIDVEAEPNRIDIEFVEGPEAGNSSHGIYELDGDQLTMCLGLVGSSRPAGFRSTPGSGHALERLRRTSPARPANVTGGRKTVVAAPAETAVHVPIDPATFDIPMTPLLHRLQGEWVPTELVRDGEAMPADWLSFGLRSMTGNEVKVVFGGQTMVHAKVKIDEGATPAAVDYLNLAGAHKGKVSLGIMEWIGDDVRFLMETPGKPRPTAFSCERGSGCTLSAWRKR
jgi:uncharacterized protein (TIGR03067 family)